MGLLVRGRGNRDEERRADERNGGKDRKGKEKERIGKKRRKKGRREVSTVRSSTWRVLGVLWGIEPQLFQLHLAFLQLGPDWLSVDRIPSGLLGMWELISINCCMHVPGNLKLELVCMNKLWTACCGKLAFATILTRVNGR